MLHAILHRKTAVARRYYGRREKGEVRITAEDEITSTVFGPLDFLSGELAARFWADIFATQENGVSLGLNIDSATQHSIQLWDRRPSISSQSVEPDLLVQLVDSRRRRRILLIEIKWRSPLSGADQLRRQWEEFLTPEERQDAFHLFIGLDTSDAIAARTQKTDLWAGKLIELHWHSVRRCAQKMSITHQHTYPGLARWASCVDAFLGACGVRLFDGFSSLGSLEKSPSNEGPVFWRRTFFESLSGSGSPVLIESPVFFGTAS